MEQKYSSVEIPQSRKLTEKGLQYQIDMKVNSLKSKKTALTKTLRKTLLLRGKCSKVYVRKQELSKAQVLRSEFEDLYHEIKEVAQGQEIVSVNAIWEQVHSEWRNFESDVMEEIKYLEQATLESCSTSSKGSNRSKISKQSGRSTTNSESQTKIDKYELQKEKAVLKVMIAFAKQERELKLAKVHQEQKLEEFELLREFELNKAKCL